MRRAGDRARPEEIALTPARLLALCCTALAGICVVLAVAVAREHRRAACWETAAEFELAPGADCADHDYARTLQARHKP